jgi:HSP20 family protein
MKFGALVPWKDESKASAMRADVVDPFTAFRRDVERLFDDFFDGFGSSALGQMRPWQRVLPSIDVTETGKDVVVTAELPGLDENELQVTLDGDVLTISGEKRAEHEHKNGDAYYVEHRFGAFSRSIRLPFAVDQEQIETKYDKGVLTIRVPKPAQLQPSVRRVDVKRV